MKISIIISFLLFVFLGQAQDANTYQSPPKNIRDLAMSPPSPTVLFDQKAEWMILLQRQAFMDIQDLAQPELKIAGIRINPTAYAQSRIPFINTLKLKNVKSGTEYEIKGLPIPGKYSFVRWSPDDKKIGLLHQNEKGNELWVIDLATKTASKWGNGYINSTLGNPFQWINEETIIAKTVRASNSPLRQNNVPLGPTIQETDGVAAPAATYQDLLKNNNDELAFDYYCTSDLQKINAKSQSTIATNAIWSAYDLSPDKKYILTQQVKRPYSYLVPYFRFASQIDIIDLNGKLVRTLNQNPLDEVRAKGFDATTKFPRNFAWRDDLPSSITWIQALDEGDARKAVEYRDALMQLNQPFAGDPKIIYKANMRLNQTRWGHSSLAIVQEALYGSRKVVIKKFNPFLPDLKPDTLFAFSSDDEYNNPGDFVLTKNMYGRSVLMTDKTKEKTYSVSQGASADGNMPYLSSIDLKSKKQEILWRCKAPYYETPVKILDMEVGTFITSRESVTESPNYFTRNYKGINPTQITQFPNPQPGLAGIKKEKIQYKRADGIDLTAVLYTPKGYDKTRDGTLPVFMWAYPREFKSAADAGQVRGSKYTFTRVGSGSPLFWVLEGYAVMDQTEMPIIGEGDQEPNDTYVTQLVANAEAAVNKITELGVGDRNRIGVGGHSYGAFMTANLLAHSDLFKAGIARSGAYNRSLTPFGFQNEERNFWEATEVYMNMSPFMHANKINEPLLLIHGEADNNSGTFPIQSERMYSAIKGNGGTARLVLLPHESHGYAAKESILHTLWEMNVWLDKNVKNPGTKSSKPKS